MSMRGQITKTRIRQRGFYSEGCCCDRKLTTDTGDLEQRPEKDRETNNRTENDI